MAEVDTSFYKPQPQQSPLDMIAKVGPAANVLGDLAQGRAMQQALDPATGQVDQNKLLGLLKQSPVGANRAVPAMDALAKLKAAGFAADQAGLETFQKRMALTSHLFSGLASKSNPSMNDVYDIASHALDPALEGSKYGITLPVVMNAIKQFRGLDAPGIKKKALEIQTQAATTSEILQQHSPAGQWVDQGGQLVYVPGGTAANPAFGTAVPKNLPPTTSIATPKGTQLLGQQPATAGGGVVGPDGKPIVSQRGAPAASMPITPAGPMTSQPPGFDPAAAAVGANSAAQGVALTAANDSSPQRKAILGNLEDLVGKFEPGVGAGWELVAKNFANRNLPVPKSWQEKGGVLDLKSVASQEEFNKLAVQLAQQQFATIGGTGTDAKFSSAFETSPNDALSKLGNKTIIQLLKGNEDAIQAKNKAWQKWQKDHGPQTYGEFSTQFNEKFDPRAFQFKYVPPKERQAYVDGMADEDKISFLTNLTHARKEGWVNFEQPKAK